MLNYCHWAIKTLHFDVRYCGWIREYRRRGKSRAETESESETSGCFCQRTGTLPIDQIKEGMYLEAQDDTDRDLVWPVKVIENVGGRLLLRYVTAETAAGDFWLFYLHHRLHPIGWARSHDCAYQPPAGSFAYIIVIIIIINNVIIGSKSLYCKYSTGQKRSSRVRQ